MPDRARAIRSARDTIADGRFTAALGALVACPTESQKPDNLTALRAYLTGPLAGMLDGLGFDSRIHDNPVATAGPILVATRTEDASLPTVLIYGHGDTVRGQAGAWSNGRDPFAVTRDADRLYGRGSADNKGQHLINLMALRAVVDARGTLGFNVKLLIEMGEETGSPGLERFCAENRDLLRADVLIASDGPRLRPDVPTVFMGSRGSVNFDLICDLRDGAHHSGNWGGLLADPAILLTHAIASITDARGQIAIPEWRPDSLTDDIRETLARLPTPGGDMTDPDWGESGLSPVERVYGWNSFAVLALHAGVPEAPQNAIAGTARATCQLRFVVGTDQDAILPALRRHLTLHGHDRIEVRAADGDAFPATRSALDGPWVQRVETSIRATLGSGPDMLPNLAGSLPNHVFQDVLGLPTVWVPHSYGGCNQHAPDEHVLLPVCEQALGVMTGVFWDIGQPQA